MPARTDGHIIIRCMTSIALACVLQTATAAAPAGNVESCNPPVRLDVDNASLAKTLQQLAAAQGFALVFPDSVERSVTLHEELPLDRLLKRLTAGVSTSLIYADHADCTGNRIVKLVVYPVGEQGEIISARRDRSRARKQTASYIYVEDMDGYVRDVLEKKHPAALSQLTPEQRVEFRMARKRIKQELKAQGKARELRRARQEARKAARSAGSAATATTNTRPPAD